MLEGYFDHLPSSQSKVQHDCCDNQLQTRGKRACVGAAHLDSAPLYLQAAPEEDLKHVFDVLDKSNEGVLTADSLRSAIKVHSADA